MNHKRWTIRLVIQSLRRDSPSGLLSSSYDAALMGSGISPSRMFPGRFDRVTYLDENEERTIEGRYAGLEAAGEGDHLLLETASGEAWIRLSSVTLIEPIEELPWDWVE